MGSAIGLRDDFDGLALRRLARGSKIANQARRLLALAEIYEGGRRTGAARIGGVGLQIVRDWVVRFNARGLGRSQGGLSTKIHVATEALGLPIRLIDSLGQRNDIAFAHDLVGDFQAAAALADKGYDADHLCKSLVKAGAEVVIPPKRNRQLQRPCDAELYKERDRIERFFCKLK